MVAHLPSSLSEVFDDFTTVHPGLFPVQEEVLGTSLV